MPEMTGWYLCVAFFIMASAGFLGGFVTCAVFAARPNDHDRDMDKLVKAAGSRCYKGQLRDIRMLVKAVVRQ